MKTQLDSPAMPASKQAATGFLARRTGLCAGLGCAALLAAVALPARAAAVTEAWVHRYNNVVSNSQDQAFKVVLDVAGDIIVTGAADDGSNGSDMLTIKYSGADGSVRWQKRYNGPANRSDSPAGLAVDGSGNAVVTGVSYNSNGDPDYYTAKYAAVDGALLWEQRYNGPANGEDYARAVAVDGKGDVVVTGYSFTSSGYPDYYTAKYAAADGALLWEQRYDGPANASDGAEAVAVDASGNVVVTGNSRNTSGGSDYYTAKYAAEDGTLLWEQRYNGPANNIDGATAVAVDGSGNVVVTGFSHNSSGNPDYYTAKYAADDGTLLWEQRYNGPANSLDTPGAVGVDGSGNVVVTGLSYTSSGYPDYYTAKYAAADGRLLWEQRYNGPANGDDASQAVGVDGSGNVVVTGYSFNNNEYHDYYTAKYAAADGRLLWDKRYNGAANNTDIARAVGVDGRGNVVVTGYSNNGSPSSDYDYYTAKYAAADGALLWEQRYNGLANSYDCATSVALDGRGNVAVTGYSYNDSGNADYYTAKYAAGNGALLWEERYNGPANFDDYAQAVAVDSSGNVVVTGYSDDESGNPDYYTAKYAAADGALLWEKRYNGPANGIDYANAVAVDDSGDVIVTGYSYKSSGNADYYTAKYAAGNGALLWEQRYNGPANRDDYARAVGVDGRGNVVVTGASYNENGTADYYTAKYAAADGTLLWEQRYTGPANGDDVASAVAVDGRGNVVVTGYSYNDSGNTDYYTTEYAAADGAVLWEQRYNGPADGDDGASAVAVDGAGNVMVTGTSYGGASTDDYYTAKYAAADGALLWEQRYNGPANLEDYALAVAVDGRDNAVVTGYSYSRIGNADYYTAKYAAADGALLWEERYNGPASRDDIVGTSHSLALGPNGVVAVTGSSSGDYATVLYRENQPPVISCPANVVAECAGSGGAVARFTVTATDDSGISPVVVCAPPSGSVFPIGRTTVTCTATDGDGLSSTCSFPVTAGDLTPPVIQVKVTPDTLWPPNHKLAEIRATVTVNDNCNPNPTFVLTSITSDEAENNLGGGEPGSDIQEAAFGTADLVFKLRADRAGTKPGRVYTIVYTASDRAGNTATATAVVRVPHSR